MDGHREVEHRVHEGADLAGLLAGLWGIRQRAVAAGRWPGAAPAGAGDGESRLDDAVSVPPSPAPSACPVARHRGCCAMAAGAAK